MKTEKINKFNKWKVVDKIKIQGNKMFNSLLKEQLLKERKFNKNNNQSIANRMSKIGKINSKMIYFKIKKLIKMMRIQKNRKRKINLKKIRKKKSNNNKINKLRVNNEQKARKIESLICIRKY